MNQTVATARPANGELAMTRLADRLAALAPPADPRPAAPVYRPSPAVAAALKTTAAISARAAERARRSRSITGMTVDGFIAVCSLVPYAAVALVLRLAMARVFFLDGQTRIDGLRFPFQIENYKFVVTLPMQVKTAGFAAFAAVPVPPGLAAQAVAYAEFVLPIVLVLGLGTRFAALWLLSMTALMQIYVLPQALWNTHVYWASILLVLLSLGAGSLSIDAFIKFLARR